MTLVLMILLIAASSAVWVAIDARKRDWAGQFFYTEYQWAAGVFLLWPIFLPLYLVQRANAPVR